jgi:hypothetical protein
MVEAIRRNADRAGQRAAVDRGAVGDPVSVGS